MSVPTAHFKNFTSLVIIFAVQVGLAAWHPALAQGALPPSSSGKKALKSNATPIVSQIAFQLKIPDAILTEAINGALDVYKDISAVERCPSPISNYCNYSLELTFERTMNEKTEIDIKSSATLLSVPLTMNGTIALRYYEGNQRMIKSYNLTAELTAVISLTQKRGLGWCDGPPPSIKIEWKSKPTVAGALLLNWYVQNVANIDEKITVKMESMLESEKGDAARKAICDSLTSRVGDVLKNYSLPLLIDDRSAFLNVRGDSLSYGPLRRTRDSIYLNVYLASRLSVTFDRPEFEGPSSAKLPLRLVRGAARPKQVMLEVPAALSFADLSRLVDRAISEAANKTDPNLQLQFRPSVVTTDGKRLIIEVNYEVGSPVYAPVTGLGSYSGIPEVDRPHNTMRLEKVSGSMNFERIIPPYQSAAAFKKVDDAITQAIKTDLRYEAEAALLRSRGEIESRIAKLHATTGIKFTISMSAPTISRVSLTPAGIEVYSNATGEMQATLTAIPPIVLGWFKDLRTSPYRRTYRIVNASTFVLQRKSLDSVRDSLTIPADAVGIKIFDCKASSTDKTYKWCDVEYKDQRGWIHQYYLAPI